VLPQYFLGTGGWEYFQVPGVPALKAYSQLFDFVEVNSTFYEYPSVAAVENRRLMLERLGLMSGEQQRLRTAVK
jgi:hypothetical protein